MEKVEKSVKYKLIKFRHTPVPMVLASVVLGFCGSMKEWGCRQFTSLPGALKMQWFQFAKVGKAIFSFFLKTSLIFLKSIPGTKRFAISVCRGHMSFCTPADPFLQNEPPADRKVHL